MSFPSGTPPPAYVLSVHAYNLVIYVKYIDLISFVTDGQIAMCGLKSELATCLHLSDLATHEIRNAFTPTWHNKGSIISEDFRGGPTSHFCPLTARGGHITGVKLLTKLLVECFPKVVSTLSTRNCQNGDGPETISLKQFTSHQQSLCPLLLSKPSCSMPFLFYNHN